jgi:hypothetical protein
MVTGAVGVVDTGTVVVGVVPADAGRPTVVTSAFGAGRGVPFWPPTPRVG